jgi:hypothetical protein
MAIQKGTGFTNLNRIMQANRGNKLGATVAGGIKGQVADVKTGVKSAQEQFQEEAQKNRLDTQEAADKRSEILGRFAPASGAANVQQAPVAQQAVPATQPAAPVNPSVTERSLQVLETPGRIVTRPPPIGGLAKGEVSNNLGPQIKPSLPGTQAALAPTPAQSPVSEEEIKDFTKFRTGTYTGPKELQDATSLYGKAQQAEALGGLSRSEGGRQELLRRFVGGGNYTQGQRQLDSSILGQQPGQLGAAARQARGAGNIVNEANVQAANLAQEFTNRAKIFGEETTKKIGETKDPLSKSLDERVSAAQKAEDVRVSNLKTIQELLSGEKEEYKGLDQWSRAGLALQEAANKGYIKDSDIKMLLGSGDKIGLLQRGGNLGLDMSKLINERFTNKAAQNLARTGVASDEDIARLNALDRLAGKQGADLEFLEGQGDFEAGQTGFNVGSLEEYIAKTEAERARSDKAYADKLAAEQARYLNQAMAGGMQALGGGFQTAGGALSLGAITERPGDTPQIIGNAADEVVTGAGNALGGTTTAVTQGAAAIMEGINKLNIGGNSLGNTEGGRQLARLIDLYSNTANAGVGAFTGTTSNIGDALGDLGRGNITGAAGNIINVPQDILRQLKSSNIGSSVGSAAKNIGSSVGSAAKSVGKKLKKVFSDEDLKEDVEYNPKDVQKFMDRIKPAAYDYKKEIKDSPLASKNRELGVMAQDLEKSKLGKEAVKDTKMGKVVDYDNLEPKMLASIAALNRRLKDVENK